MTPEYEAGIRALATRFFDAVARDDLDTAGDCYADEGFVLWHNFDNAEKTKAQSLASLATIPARVTDRSYDERRLNVFDGGFVQQHVLNGTRVGDGKRLAMAAAIVCQVKDGKIARLDEYLDSKDVTEFRKIF